MKYFSIWCQMRSILHCTSWNSLEHFSQRVTGCDVVADHRWGRKAEVSIIHPQPHLHQSTGKNERLTDERIKELEHGQKQKSRKSKRALHQRLIAVGPWQVPSFYQQDYGVVCGPEVAQNRASALASLQQTFLRTRDESNHQQNQEAQRESRLVQRIGQTCGKLGFYGRSEGFRGGQVGGLT